MSLMKPSVAANPPIIVTATGNVSISPREVVAIHYLNTTAGAGRVDITGASNEGVTLGSDAANGNDDFCPSQPMKFKKIVVTFTTGTGVVTILTS
jgi:hypothetical protein